MPVETMPTCPAGVTAQTISAWRDDTLPPGAAGQLTAHFAGCAACQARLARYADLADALRAQPLPGPDGRLRAAVRTRIRSGPRPRVTLQLGRVVRARRRVWGGLGALAAALLLVAGFAQLFRVGARTGLPASTPTPGVVSWHAATFPAGFVVPASANQSLATRSLDVAPSDGNTAYACMAPAQGQRTQPVIWVTHDRAAHWTERARVPVVGDATNCVVNVDLANTAVAVVDALEASAADELFVTFDAAATWQPLAASGLTALGRLTTVHGRTYALAQGSWYSGAVAQERLVVTSDHFASVRTLDDAIIGRQGTDAYWVNPASGALLARTERGLWQSTDGGATWTAIALPRGVTAPMGLAVMAVQTPNAAGPWHICLDESVPTTNNPYAPDTNDLYCTTDGGQSWQERSGQQDSYPYIAALAGMVLAADGAVLVALPNSGAQTPAAGYTLYRLPAGSIAWQNAGAVPTPNLIYVPEPGQGVLWAVSSPELVLGSYTALLNMGGSQSAAISTATYG